MRKLLVLPVVVALVLPVLALTMTVLPPTTAEAHLALFCEPEEDTGPSLARPRVSTTGKDLNGGDLVPGDEILWTVTVKNIGDKLTGIVITDVVPENTTYVAGSIEGVGANDAGAPTLTWAVGALKCGEKATVSFKSRVDDGVPVGTLISNQASGDSAQTPAGKAKAATLKVTGSSAVSDADSSTPTTVAADGSKPDEDGPAKDDDGERSCRRGHKVAWADAQ